MKEEIFKEEMKNFNINVDDIQPSDNLFGAIQKAIIKLNIDDIKNRYEVILNNNLIEFKDKITNYRTILGCKVSYEDLAKSISFIVKPNNEPTYEELQYKIESLEEDVEYWKEKYKELEDSLNNDYDPEIDIPQIHGEGISW